MEERGRKINNINDQISSYDKEFTVFNTMLNKCFKLLVMFNINTKFYKRGE